MPYDPKQVTEFRVTKVDAEIDRKYKRLCQLQGKSRNQAIKDHMAEAIEQAEEAGQDLEAREGKEG